MQQIAIRTILFLTSFVFMGLEIVSVRMVTPFFGSTVYTWGVLITIFLAGSSVGYWIGGKTADLDQACTWIRGYFATSILSLSLLPLSSSALLPTVQEWPAMTGLFISSLLLFILPNALLGAIVPGMTKMGLVQELSGWKIGSYHMFSSFGSIAGTLATTFVLLPLFHVNLVLSLLIGLLAASFFIFTFFVSRSKLTLPLLLSAACILPYVSEAGQVFQGNLIAQMASPYHTLYVTERDSYRGKEGTFRFLQFEKGGYQGGLNLKEPDELLLAYARNMMGLLTAYRPDADAIYMAGHGIGSLTRKLSSQVKNLEVAEIDQQVLEVSKSFFRYEGNEVVIGDGRVVLQQKENNSLDAVLLDAFSGGSIPVHLTTQEFFLVTRDKLKNNGILLMNVIGETKKDRFIESMYGTVASVYPYVKIFATNPDEANKQNLFIVASPSSLKDQTFPECVEIPYTKGAIMKDGDSKFVF